MLVVVRHGRTEANARGLLVGSRLDPDLDPLGASQAAAVAAVLHRADRVVSSPLRRARRTAEVVAAASGVEVERDDRWAEIDYGELDGTPLGDVPPELWRSWQVDPSFAPPGGESHEQLHARVARACESLASDAAERMVVVVSHVSPIKAALAWALGVGPAIAWRSFVAPASITRIATGARVSLHAFNVTAHLDGLDVPAPG